MSNQFNSYSHTSVNQIFFPPNSVFFGIVPGPGPDKTYIKFIVSKARIIRPIPDFNFMGYRLDELFEFEATIKDGYELSPLPFKEQEINFEIKKVYYNNPVIVVLWMDGTKTIVTAIDEPYDPEKGLAMALAKKVYGNKGNYFEKLKKWLPKTEEKNTEDTDSGSSI